MGTATVTFNITVDNGKISWKAYSNNDIYDEFCGEYVDENPFSLSGAEATFCFFGTYDTVYVAYTGVLKSGDTISKIHPHL